MNAQAQIEQAVPEQRSRLGGWGSSYSDTVPGGASGQRKANM